MTDWKNDLRTLADKLRADQKNKKGFQSKFAKVVGYKKKLGFNDTGVPLTAKAAKSLERNRAAYTGRRSRRTNYEGSTLQQINEERAAAAKERWKHLGKLGSRHSSDKAPTKKEYSSSELIWRSSITSRSDRSDGWSNQRSTFKGYGYGDAPVDDGSVEIDLSSYREKPVQAVIPNFDENKFPKVAEAIRAIKNKKLN
jgi:hypothetical protein